MAQLDDVHSVLGLNYETPKGLISLAPPNDAKPTLFEIEAGGAAQSDAVPKV